MKEQNPARFRKRLPVAGERGEHPAPAQILHAPELPGPLLSRREHERFAHRRAHGKGQLPCVGENLAAGGVEPPRLRIDEFIRDHVQRFERGKVIGPFFPRVEDRETAVVFREIVAGVDQRDRPGGELFERIARSVPDHGTEPNHPAEAIQRHRIFRPEREPVRTADHGRKRDRSGRDAPGAEQRRSELVRQRLYAVVRNVEVVGHEILLNVPVPVRPGELAEHVPPLQPGVGGHQQRPLGPEAVRFAEVELGDTERPAIEPRQKQFVRRCSAPDRRILVQRRRNIVSA